MGWGKKMTYLHSAVYSYCTYIIDSIDKGGRGPAFTPDHVTSLSFTRLHGEPFATLACQGNQLLVRLIAFISEARLDRSPIVLVSSSVAVSVTMHRERALQRRGAQTYGESNICESIILRRTLFRRIAALCCNQAGTYKAQYLANP